MQKRKSIDGLRLETHRIRNSIVPALLTALSIGVVAYMLSVASLDIRAHTGLSVLIFASFASSAFLLFMLPRSKTARPARFVKSYIIAALLGYLGALSIAVIGEYATIIIIIFVVAMLLPLFDAGHPPAVGIAFAFMLFGVGYAELVLVALGIALLLAMRLLLERAVYIIEEDVESIGRRERRGADRYK